MCKIIKMTAQDIEDWAKLRFQLWDSKNISAHKGDIRCMLANQNGFGYLATTIENKPIGFAECSIREYANGCKSQPVPFLEGIWVAPQYRRKRIATKLVDAITLEFLKNGFEELISDTHIDNIASQKAHIAWGFGEVDRVVYFRKTLI